jgi:hypothetical protein
MRQTRVATRSVFGARFGVTPLENVHVATSGEKERGIGPRPPPDPSVQLAKIWSVRRVVRAQIKLPRVAQSGFRV